MSAPTEPIPVGGFRSDDLRTLDPVFVDTAGVYPPEMRNAPVGGFATDDIRTLGPFVVDTSNVYPPDQVAATLANLRAKPPINPADGD